jgi:hypothetical protein
VGYAHAWSCSNYYSAQQCYDSGYHPWYEIHIYAHNYHTAIACLASSSPDSNAYGFWAGTGGPTPINGEAKTPASRQFC